MPRPRRPGVVRVRLTLCLDAVADADLIAFYAASPAGQRAAPTNARRRVGGAQPAGSATEEDVPDDLLDLLE